jgi:hypothetical protein
MTVIPGLDLEDHVGQLAARHDRAERTRLLATAAADAALVVDDDPAVLGFADRVHGAGVGAGERDLDDGVERAGLGAKAAVHALVAVDLGAAVLDVDRLLGAVADAGAGEAAAAQVGHGGLAFEAGGAAFGENGDEGLRVAGAGRDLCGVGRERLELVGLVLHAEAERRHHAVAQGGAVFVDAAARKGLAFGAHVERDAVEGLGGAGEQGPGRPDEDFAFDAVGFVVEFHGKTGRS